MTLRLSNNTLTRYVERSGYAAAENVPLVGDLAAVANSLLVWLTSQLSANESLTDVILEESGKVATEFETQTDEEGNELQVPTNFRKVLNAAVSVNAPLGSRTFVAKSEQLPEELRDSLLGAWDLIISTI